NPVLLDHFHYQSYKPASNDAPDMTDMLDAMRVARTALNASLTHAATPAEHRRLVADERRLVYAEATLAFFDHLLRLYIEDVRGKVEQARGEWTALDASARRLRAMTDASRGASSDADSPNGLTATEAVDLYDAFAKKYGGPARSR